MRYTYDIMERTARGVERRSTTTDGATAYCAWKKGEYYTRVSDSLKKTHPFTLETEAEWDAWFDVLGRQENWHKEPVSDAVNPTHHGGFYKDMQWIEAYQHHPRFKDRSEHFVDVLDCLLRKYVDRCGRKDDAAQELKKAEWYLKFLILYRRKGPVELKGEEPDVEVGVTQKKEICSWFSALAELPSFRHGAIEIVLEADFRRQLERGDYDAALGILRYWIGLKGPTGE